MKEAESSPELAARFFAAELRGNAVPQLDLHGAKGDIESRVDQFFVS